MHRTVVNLYDNKIVRLLGKVENTERFLAISLFQGAPKRKRIGKNQVCPLPTCLQLQLIVG